MKAFLSLKKCLYAFLCASYFHSISCLAAVFNNQWSLCCTWDLRDFVFAGANKSKFSYALLPRASLWHSDRCLLRSAWVSTSFSSFHDRQSLPLKPHLVCLPSLVLFLSLQVLLVVLFSSLSYPDFIRNILAEFSFPLQCKCLKSLFTPHTIHLWEKAEGRNNTCPCLQF